MPNDTTFYIERHPGDLVTAEDWNDLQSKIQADLKKKIDEAKQAVIDGGVKRADNADKFDNKTPKNWTDELDQRYAPKVHDHEGLANYRRYFREMDAEETLVVLDHKLHRLPLVDIYELMSLNVPAAIRSPNANQQQNPKFLLYYGHEELDLLQANVVSNQAKRLPRKVLGTPWEPLLQEYVVEYEDDDSLNDVINDFFDAFFKLPAADDILAHEVSKWIDSHQDDRTIADLKKRDEWDDIRWLYLPRKLPLEKPTANADNQPQIFSTPLEVVHMSYDALAVILDDTAAINLPLDVMFLLRS